MRPRLLLALSALATAPSARAEIALLANGTTLKVEVLRTEGESVYLTLKGGGEVGVPAALLVGVVPDELIDEITPGPGGADMRALAVAAARRHGLEPALVLAVARVESGLHPDAVSPKGAQGLMQLMPKTAASLGVEDPFDPTQNLDGGARHLGSLLQRYDGDVAKALAAYNAGEGAVARHRGVPPYRETRNYVKSVLRKYQEAP
jgi:hypothetical protein